MARSARIVVPGYPHHITQRGNRKEKTFFNGDDYRAYLRMLSKEKERAGAAVLAYCLMPNHVHIVVVPDRPDSLAKLFKEGHRKYTRRINSRMRWIGHLWQERFHSFPMDEQHLLGVVRYVELNPVRAGICANATDWPWSSVHAHFRKEDDILVDVAPMLDRISDWSTYLNERVEVSVLDNFRKHTNSGRPAGSEGFLDELEELTGQRFRKRKPGPRPTK